jgi:putative heme-binding domain-containing protein
MNSRFAPIAAMIAALLLSGTAHAQTKLALNTGDRVTIIGNALAERMQHDGWLETQIAARFPRHQLTFRNLGFSGDELTTRARSAGFGSPDQWLTKTKTDVVFAFFGYNESFQGEAGLDRFKAELANFIRHTRGQKYNGKSPARLVLFSPIAFENLNTPNLPNGYEHNKRLELYTAAMQQVAAKEKVAFVDLFAASKRLYESSKKPLTINGVHLTSDGNRLVANAAAKLLFPEAKVAVSDAVVDAIQKAVADKNFYFYHRYRTTDGYNVYGGRSSLAYPDKTTGRKITNYEICQREMQILDVMTTNRDKAVWAAANGKTLKVDDGNTPPFIPITTNKPGPLPGGKHVFLDGKESIAKMTLGKALKVNLFADERQFPELINPVQMAFDTKGRLWVSVWPSYPHWVPKEKMDDKLLILEDTDGDGKADRCKTFAGGLHCPTGFEFWGGGVIVVDGPTLRFLKDTDGDDKADVNRIILHGFDTADSHHTANSFVLDPGGAVYFGEGVFHRSQIETVHQGAQRNNDACIWRFNPRTWKVERFVPSGFANPHGHVVDRWGNHFIHDGTGAQPYHGALFSGHVDHPGRQPKPPQLYQQRTRPCPGTEILSSGHFPKAMQGNLLVGNVIGFQGILQYRFNDKGASFGATETEPIIFSSDPNFRPTDLEIAPDGSLYMTEWQNPIIGHMQHHLRDPSRDREHGRVYRITYEGRPLLKPAKIAGEPLPRLLDLLKDPIDRVRYRVRIELSGRPTKEVIAAVGPWVAKLDPKDKDHEHHLMEALWLHQSHNVLNDKLLRRMLRSPNHHARAAATRVLCDMRDNVAFRSSDPDAASVRVADALDLLKLQADDEHPRVRLEAVRGASFFRDAKAAEVALTVLNHPTDPFLDFTLTQTMKQLQPYWKAAIAAGKSLAADNPAGVNYLLGNVSTAELVKLPRTAMVYQALLTRPQVLPKYREEAAMALAKLNKSDMPAELLAAMERIDKSTMPDAQSVLFDLAHLFTAGGHGHDHGHGHHHDFTKYRDRVEKLATTAKRPITRRVAYVTLITADKSIEGVWKRASQKVDTLRDVVDTVALIRDPKLRAAMHPRVAPLLTKLPPAIAAKIKDNKGTVGRYVRIEVPGRRKTLTLAEVEVFADGKNIARNGKARQSSTAHGGAAQKAIDGNKSGRYGDGGQTHTRERDRSPWWEVDLGAEYPIEAIVVWNRTDSPQLGNRLNNFTLSILDASRKPVFQKEGNKAPRQSVRFELQGDPAGAIKRAAINAVTYTGVDQPAVFKQLAGFVLNNDHRTAAIRAMSRIHRSHWSQKEVNAVLAAIVTRLRNTPVKDRTSPAILDELALGNRLATALPKKQAQAARKTLRELGVLVIRIRPVPHKMLYDRGQIFVEAGKPVEIVFDNIDIMPHNLVITQPGQLAKVGIAAEEMAQNPDAFAKQFIPDLPSVMHYTNLLQPGQVGRLSFVAPTKLGEYPYVCTFPGHWRRMYGTMHVVKSLDDLPPEAFAPASDPEIQSRPFVRAWKLDELAADLKKADRGRNFEQGKTLFTAISCVQCHGMNNVGGKVGPDLADVKKKLAEGKMKRLDVLREMVDPSAKIDKKYQTVVIVDANGKIHTGIVVERTKDAVKLLANPLDKKPPVTIKLADIDEEYPSKVSMMPLGLLNTMTLEEILDLLAYIESGGDAEHRAFKK